MKTLLLAVLALSSVSSFAKGGSRGPTERCEGTRQKVIETVADSFNDYIVYDIRWSFTEDGLKIKKEDVVRTDVAEVAQRGNDLGTINIIHNVEKAGLGMFLTQVGFRDIRFVKEEEINGVTNCVWSPDVIGFMKTYQVVGENYKYVNARDIGHGKVKIPLN